MNDPSSSTVELVAVIVPLLSQVPSRFSVAPSLAVIVPSFLQVALKNSVAGSFTSMTPVLALTKRSLAKFRIVKVSPGTPAEISPWFSIVKAAAVTPVVMLPSPPRTTRLGPRTSVSPAVPEKLRKGSSTSTPALNS